MPVSRRELLKQVPNAGSLRALGRLAASFGLGALVNGDDPDAPGAVEEAGLALGRKAAAPAWRRALEGLSGEGKSRGKS